MIEAIVFLWLLLIIFIDIRVRAVEKRINQLEEKLLKQRGNTNDSKTINS
jgi:hypothetical protein